MKLLYITNARIPTEKAHGLQIVKMCEAFQQQGMDVELFVPFRVQSPAMRNVKDIWAHYDVDTPFRIRRIPAVDFIPFDNVLPRPIMMGLYYLQSLLFSLCALLLTWFRKDCVYYSRDLPTVFLLGLTRWLHRKPYYFEAHEVHGSGAGTGMLPRVFHSLMQWMLRRVDGVIVITAYLQEAYRTLGGAEQQILVAPDGVDRKRLLFSLDKVTTRARLDIPQDRKVVCYTGHLFQWKGVHTLVESRKYLPEDYLVYIVGGTVADVEALQQFIAKYAIHNIVLTGYLPYRAVVDYLCAADLLILPNSARAKISREYTSPLKLFEYMAAQRPIVASDLPSLREVLRHQENAYLVHPDDSQALAAGILHVMGHTDLGDRLQANAYQDVQRYTWDIRAENIIAYLENSTYVSEKK